MAKERFELRITGMTCDGCAEHVTRALEGVAGVMEAHVPGWRSGRAEVVGEGVDPEALVRAVEVAGYGAEVVARTPEPATPDGGSGAKVELRIRAPEAEGAGEGAEVMVIGGGSAGFAAALRAAELGARVTLVEAGTIGGTCVNVGCVPSKTLLRAVERHHRAARTPLEGVSTAAGALHWARVIAQKDALVAELRQKKYVDVLAAYPRIALLRGRARLTPEGVEVDGQLHTPDRIVLAVGARPWAPPIPGLAEVPYLTSTEALALRALPRSLAVLGAGGVGLELAQIFARAGVAVTLLEALPRIAPLEEPEVSAGLREALEAEGIRVYEGVQVVRVEEDRGEVVLHLEGEPATVRAEKLLVATGRRPNTEGLNLEAAGVEVGPRGEVKIDRYGRTSNPRIYAAGDCADLPQFVYVAAHSGTVAAENALRGPVRPLDLEALPRVTFTDPQVAAAGLTEAQAREQGLAVKTSVLPLEHVPRALAARETRGLIKLVAEAESGRLLGAHLLAPEAGEAIQTAVLAIRAGMTVDELARVLFPYLTLVEGLKLAAQAFEKDVALLSCCAG